MSSTPENDVVVASKFKISDLWRKEDWLSIWIAFAIILTAAIGSLSGWYDFSGAKFATWGVGAGEFAGSAKACTVSSVFTTSLGMKLLLTFGVFGLLFTLGNKLEGFGGRRFLAAFAALFVLVAVVRLLSAEITFNRYLEYAFWALLLGLLVTITVKSFIWVMPALRAEFYI